MQFNKSAISVAHQIQLLSSRGLIIDDYALAEHFLSQVSYYRLAGYWWPLQANTTTHKFKPGSDFETVIALYNFDRELRLVAFNMIERIEIGLRTQLIYHMSTSYDPWWFDNDIYFKNKIFWKKHINDLRREIKRSREVFIAEHSRKYHTDQRLPPAWKSLEVISLSALSKIYENLNNTLPEKKIITRKLGLNNHTFLTSWLQSIAVVRNICAHHSRLWNRNLPTPPRLPAVNPLPWVDIQPLNPNKFYTILCCMYYLLQTISPDNQFKARLLDLFHRYPNVDPKAMGFPKNWQQENMWKS